VLSTAANTYTGQTNINAGILQIQATSSLGAVLAPTVVANGRLCSWQRLLPAENNHPQRHRLRGFNLAGALLVTTSSTSMRPSSPTRARPVGLPLASISPCKHGERLERLVKVARAR